MSSIKGPIRDNFILFIERVIASNLKHINIE